MTVPTVDELVARLRAQADPDNVVGMARYGISPVGTLGVSLPLLRGIARELKPLAKADAWVAEVDSWDVCDGLCNNLLDKTPVAFEKADEWAAGEPEFVKREADDQRPSVKKAANWALRQIGKRNANLNAAAVAVAARLRDSGSRAARWVAADALRELNSDAVLGRVARSRE